MDNDHHVRPSSSFTRLGLLSWNSGDTLTANDLNANFAAVNSASVDLTSDQAVAGVKTFSGNVNVSGQLGVGLVWITETPSTLSHCSHCMSTAAGCFDCSCPTGTRLGSN